MTEYRHDIVSLLYSVKGMIETHRARIDGGVFGKIEEQLEHAEEILRVSYFKADSAIQITKRLRTVAEPDDCFRTHRKKVSVRFAWRIVTRKCFREISSGGIEFVDRIPAAFPPVLCDRGQFLEILYQIALNGAQAALKERRGENERPKLVIRAQEGFSPAEEPCAMIAIADTGPGIAGERLPHLFKPFMTTKPEGEGNGLGLYFIKQLVLRNGGKIGVSSFPGAGTTFTLEFPISARRGLLKA